MKFLHPNFLWALFFLAVPIIIHLFYFRRYQRVLFSNTQFLSEIKDEQATRNKLKHLLVLLSRLLAVLFLVFAFAQPFIPDNENSNAGEKAISVYLDNSFSMQTEGNGFLLFDEAKAMAKSIIETYAETNKFQILTNDFEAKHQGLLSKSEVLSLLDQVTTSAASQKKEMVFEKQKNGLKNAAGSKLIYQLSDFQLNDELFKADTLYQTNLVRFEPSVIRNISIDEVYFENPIQLKGQQNKLIVKLRNQSEEEQSGSFQLSINEENKSIGNYTIRPNSAVFDTLQFTISADSWNRGKIVVNDYPMTFDDTYYFTFLVEDQLKVYTIFEGNGEKYPKAVFSNNEQLAYQSNNLSNIDYNLLDKQHLVVLSNLKSIPSGLSESLKTYLNAGGQVFFIPNADGSIPSYNQFLNSLNAGSFLQRKTENRNVNAINFNHDLLVDVFEEKPNQLALPNLKSYYVLQNQLSQESVMSFADGSNYLASVAVGNGQFYVLSSGLGDSYSNFTQQAIFAPICYRMAILGAKNVDIAYPIEASTKIYLSELPSNEESILRLVKDEMEIIPAKSILNGNLLLTVPGMSLSSDIYKVQDISNEYYAEVALNYNRSEGDLSFYSEDELKENFANSNVQILQNNLAIIKDNVKQMEDGKSFWKLCLILALLFLAIEILLLRFLPN
ncbi:MAG: hypothetical protein ACI9O4_002403 [Chitinophagales bacterium]|jgi:hypothetical protein